ncbi:MAG: hypothetical protein WD425_14150 [Nitrospirales bacterium]
MPVCVKRFTINSPEARYRIETKGLIKMKGSKNTRLPYEVVRSRRSTADIIIERNGSVLIRAPEWCPQFVPSQW